ncbi:MAG TPA: response regulator [Deltaproteobacteria bacterium]|nr:response regulator [Deltaproteobacteria bacterium]HPR53897.1 response regulator [Deltaproteobacteria bacterium]
MRLSDQGYSALVYPDDHAGLYLQPLKFERLYRTHYQGAIVRSGASALIWVLTLVAFWKSAISRISFEGASIALLFLVLLNIPMLLILKHTRRKLSFEVCSFLIHLLEILGYTAFIYFMGGFRATYLTPIYAAMIFYVGVLAPMRYPLILAVFCSFSFSLMVFLEHAGFFPHQNPFILYSYSGEMIIFVLTILTAILFVVALIAALTASMIRSAKRSLRDKNLALEMANRKMRQEIDERVRAEGALRESEKKLQDIFENVSDALYSHDLEGNFIEVNGGFRKALGCGERSPLPVGLNLRDLVPDKYRTLVDTYLEDIAQQGRSEGLMSVVTMKGVQRVIEYRNSLIKDDQGIPLGVRGSGRDITQRLIADREKEMLQDQLQKAQKMEAIGVLAGGVAHDLNNILSGLVSFPDLLLMEIPEDSPMKKPLLTIKRSGEKAASIVQDLLTMARRGVCMSEVTNLNQVVREYLESPDHGRIMSVNKRVSLEISLDPDLKNIMGSPTQLCKSIMNLVANAVESIPGSGTVRIATWNRVAQGLQAGSGAMQEGGYAVFSIADTGVGMTEKDKQHIFEPFYTKKAMGRGGTGLGMAVVWGTVKDHQGSLEIQSEAGKGSMFTLMFPVTGEEKPREEAPASLKDFCGRGEMILVVDDVKEQREIAAGILARLGYRVETVSSGEDAVEFVRGRGVDLLVLDMIMNPGIDGLETYRRILEINPEQKAVIASGYSETDRVKEALKIGAGAYIRKPYHLQKIGIAIRDALSRRAA